MTRRFVVAAPSSGSGKTTVTLGLLRAFRDAGKVVSSAKIGPDYIDPQFHEAASGRPCVNLDGWAMRRDRLLGLARSAGQGADVLVVEGVMGLFDRSDAPGVEGTGSTADVAKTVGAPVILVVDCSGMAQSVGALADGFRRKGGPDVAAVVLNRVASARHEALLRAGCAEAGVPVVGALPRSDGLKKPSRHLGLVQAQELDDLETIIDSAAKLVASHLDLDAILSLAEEGTAGEAGPQTPPVAPLGQRVAVASDVAFRFAYPHVLAGWRAAGAEISFFSPLADEGPAPEADAIFLPGGYPELHAARLAGAGVFASAMRDAARNSAIYGECGGYMALGEGLIDADGVRHAMLGLLPHETSFATRRLHLGYRHATLASDGPLGRAGATLRAHEFHYATIVRERGEPLFTDRSGSTIGLIDGRVCGSFLHVIDAS